MERTSVKTPFLQTPSKQMVLFYIVASWALGWWLALSSLFSPRGPFVVVAVVVVHDPKRPTSTCYYRAVYRVVNASTTATLTPPPPPPVVDPVGVVCISICSMWLEPRRRDCR